MQLNDDRTQATLAINKTLTALELESLIHELAVLRAQMDPPILQSPQESHNGQAPVSVQNEPAVAFENQAKEAHITMYLRSTGLGWTAWRLHPQTQKALADFFYARLPSSSSNIKPQPRPSRN